MIKKYPTSDLDSPDQSLVVTLILKQCLKRIDICLEKCGTEHTSMLLAMLIGEYLARVEPEDRKKLEDLIQHPFEILGDLRFEDVDDLHEFLGEENSRGNG